MSYVIGIDIGATKSILKIQTTDYEDICLKTGGGGNLNSLAHDIVKSTITDLITSSLRENNLSAQDCAGICIGAAGADRTREQKIYLDFISQIGINQNITIVSDAEIALEGASNSINKILLISGTGSVCYAKNEKGEKFRAGG